MFAKLPDDSVPFEHIHFDGAGLIPAIIQDVHNHTVLMLGYMNRESLRKTILTGLVTFWSRSRQKLWTKGETSGHFLKVVSIMTDCDRDALLIKVEPNGPTCHTGRTSCFSWLCPSPHPLPEPDSTTSSPSP